MPTNVATLAELQTAVVDTGISAIAVTADIDVTSAVTCQRSDLTIDCGGHTLTNDCSSTVHEIFVFESVIVDQGFVGIGQPGSPTRHSSLVTGTITAAGTTLQVHDEVALPSPGDIVSLACGVNTSDPAEPYITLVKTVLSVTGPVSGTYTITFTTAFGVNVPTYTDADDLKAHTASSNYYKIQSTGSYGQWYNDAGDLSVSPWTDQVNFTKGLGTKHGMTQFVGGVMNHNVTLKNGVLHTILPADPSTVNSDFPLIAGDVFGFMWQDFTINNVFGSAFHSERSHDQTITGITITGTGVGSGGGVTYYADGFSSWGGTGQTYSDITWDHTTNINGFNFEVRENDITVDNLTFDGIEFDPTGITNHSANFIFGLFTAFNCDVGNVTYIPGASAVTWTGFGQTTKFHDITFSSSTIPATLYVGDVLSNPATEDWTDGNITIDGKTYGLAITVSKTSGAAISVPPGSPYQWVRMPRGMYLSMRVRLTTVGSCTDLHDPLGNHYSTTVNTWTDSTGGGAHSWGTIDAGTVWTDYEDGTHGIGLSFTGSSSAVVEIEVTYLPLVGAATWRDWHVVGGPYLTVANDPIGVQPVNHTDSGIFWDLDADSNDDSGGGHNGTDTSITYPPATFVSPGSHIALTGIASGGTTYTIAGWVNGLTHLAYNCLLTDTGGNFGLFTMSDGKLNLYTGADHQSSGTVAASALHHVCVSVAAGLATFYIDGVASGTSSSVGSGTFSRFGYDGSDQAYTGTMQSWSLYPGIAQDAAWAAADCNSGTPIKFAGWNPVAGTLSQTAVTATTASLSYATVTAGTSPYSNQLQVSTVSGSGYSNIGSPVVGATAAFNPTGLTPATDYYFITLSTDSLGQTATSNEVHVTTSAAAVVTNHLSFWRRPLRPLRRILR